MRLLVIAFLSLLLVALHACQKHEFQTVALQHELKTQVWKWDMNCLQQDAKVPYWHFRVRNLCWLSSTCLAWVSWSLQFCRSYGLHCMHVRRMCPQQFLFFSVVGKSFRRRIGNETWIVYNKILETHTSIFDPRPRSLSSIFLEWVRFSLQSYVCCWLRWMRVKRIRPQQLLFISTVDQLISAPVEDGRVEMRHGLSTTRY